MIKITQVLPTSKIQKQYMGLYRITCRNKYSVLKVGTCEGPMKTTTGSDYMKFWRKEEDNSSDVSDHYKLSPRWNFLKKGRTVRKYQLVTHSTIIMLLVKV